MKKNSKLKKFLLIIIVSILIVIIGATIYVYNNVNNATDKSYEKVNSTKMRKTDNLTKNSKPLSILLMGTDTGSLGRNYKGRTDTLMIMTVNPKKKTTVLTSIPRDMKVDLPEFPNYSPSKINAAYTYGGSKETINVVQKYFNLPIDYYVLVNMGGLKKSIDQVGGVDVVSPLTFKYESASFEKGKKYHLNGDKALKFSRMRYDDPQGDYGRQYRQQLILKGLLKKADSYKSVLSNEFLNSLSDQIKTNLKQSDLFHMVLNYRDSGTKVINQHVQGNGEMLYGQSYQNVSSKELKEKSDVIKKNLIK